MYSDRIPNVCCLDFLWVLLGCPKYFNLLIDILRILTGFRLCSDEISQVFCLDFPIILIGNPMIIVYYHVISYNMYSARTSNAF